MAEKSSPHAGHRARMRQRLMETSPASFAEHEILEMLLYYTNARGDTNEIAHALIEAFGSIEGILDADPARLEAVWGIGESSTVLFPLLGETARRYATQKFSFKPKDNIIDTPDKAAKFLARRFIGATKELAYALLLDNSMRPLDCFPVGDGSVSSISLSVRNIAERAYTKRATGVIIAHNHPGGLAVPSSDDMKVTQHLKESLSLLEISLIEHLIFSDTSYTQLLTSTMPKENAAFAASPIFDKIEANFYKKKGDLS